MYIILETLKPQFPTFSEYVRLHSISSFSSQFFLEQTLLNQFQLETIFFDFFMQSKIGFEDERQNGNPKMKCGKRSSIFDVFSHFRLIIPPAILMGITLAFREIPSSNLGIAACSCLGTCRDLQHRNALVFGTTCMNPSSTIRDPIWANWQCGSAPLIGM